MTKVADNLKQSNEKSELRNTNDNIADKKKKRVENVTKRFKNKIIRQNDNKNKEQTDGADQETSSKIPEEDLQFYPNTLSNNLVGIAYPGNVENIDKALETLGGLKTISGAVTNEKRRLELRFRPKDAYCKPCCADRDDYPGIFIKVKVRRVIPTGPSCSSSVVKPIKETYETTVLGVTKFMYKFKTLNDFQYLPIDLKQGSTYPGDLVCIYEKLVPKETPDYAWIKDGEDLAKNSLFLPPPIFSRFDSMYNIIGKKVIRSKPEGSLPEGSLPEENMPEEKVDEPEHVGEDVDEEEEEEEDDETRTDLPTLLRKMEQQKQAGKDSLRRDPDDLVVGRSRRRRVRFGVVSHFKDENVPQKPAPNAIKMVSFKFLDAYHTEITNLFNDRPIWSKNAIQFKTKLSKVQLKFLLPTVAYYFQSGPWRCMWVRYAYDPRKDPSSRKYQTFDFRVRKGGVDLKVKPKREFKTHLLPFKSTVTKVPLLKSISLLPPEEAKESEGEKLEESSFLFRPGTLPPSRQCLYQYCDILLPEIQAMLSRLPDIIADQKCHEKTGWLPSGFDDQCREIMNKHCSETIKNNLLEEQQLKLQRVKISDENKDNSGNNEASGEEDVNDEEEELNDAELYESGQDSDDGEVVEIFDDHTSLAVAHEDDNVHPSTSSTKN